ncbi:hypothetical protein [Promicromonospora sp. NPDC050249]|uniref:hypothetical protein n=1 Tax=Promicromonospora sp. NPDC050249 TaxID=3154743 RepID=UPI0033FA1C13
MAANDFGDDAGTPKLVRRKTIGRITSQATVDKIDLEFNKRWIKSQVRKVIESSISESRPGIPRLPSMRRSSNRGVDAENTPEVSSHDPDPTSGRAAIRRTPCEVEYRPAESGEGWHKVTPYPVFDLEKIVGTGDASTMVAAADAEWDGSDGQWVTIYAPGEGP